MNSYEDPMEKPVSQSGSKATTIAVVIGVIGTMCCLIPFVAIAILTLLGPQIGNVFSRITAGLESTPIP